MKMISYAMGNRNEACVAKLPELKLASLVWQAVDSLDHISPSELCWTSSRSGLLEEAQHSKLSEAIFDRADIGSISIRCTSINCYEGECPSHRLLPGKASDLVIGALVF
ncbi:hypothetical protein R1flu_005103 [Riccia fluitans]|uniref:Uncharacterized protein n=1 Tax=Riccia fluitans TaxID=41844 RepID=A0ABD1YV06_9MARC